MGEPTFLGYVRGTGQVGVRNHLAVLATGAAASLVATRIAALIPGAVALAHPHGEGEWGPDAERTRRLLVGICQNPNVGATLVVGHSRADELDAEDLAAAIGSDGSGRPVAWLRIAESGGSAAAIRRGQEIAQSWAELFARAERVSVPAAKLVLGAKCGGSDFTSGLASNPTLGHAVDRLIAAGGTALFCETPEIIGAEHLLARRAVTPDVARRLWECTARYEEAVARVGVDMRGGNPSPGNIAGGLTTLEEKSLGCVSKAGHSPLQGVLDYAQAPPGPGLFFMDSPGNDLESVTGMVAAGCQVVCFTTGRGTPTGSPIAPVIKLCANPQTSRRMADNIDLDLSPVLEGERSLEDAGQELFALILEVASGKRVKAEILGHREFSVSRIAPTL